MAQIDWFHRIDLGSGVVTPGRIDPRETLATLDLPADLSGLSVLDVGAWDGFYSFEAERRGAKQVLATDDFSWGGDGWGTQNGFLLARTAFNSKVMDQKIDVLELSPERVGMFDLVLFLGVLYHMRHPLLALERVFSVTRDRLILETHVDLRWLRRPALAFYPGSELNQDGSNWFGPNAAAVVGMLKAVGFGRVTTVRNAVPISDRMRALLRKPNPRNFPARLMQGRMVFHAWRK